jgi:hypothetical protein
MIHEALLIYSRHLLMRLSQESQFELKLRRIQFIFFAHLLHGLHILCISANLGPRPELLLFHRLYYDFRRYNLKLLNDDIWWVFRHFCEHRRQERIQIQFRQSRFYGIYSEPFRSAFEFQKRSVVNRTARCSEIRERIESTSFNPIENSRSALRRATACMDILKNRTTSFQKITSPSEYRFE